MKIKCLVLALTLLAVLAFIAGCKPVPAETGTPAVPTSGVPATTAVIPSTTVTSVADPAPVVPTPVSNPVIIIAYSPVFVLQQGLGNVLIVNLSIQNQGYDSFNTSPEYFSATINNARFTYNAELSDLKAVDIPNGGKINGKLAFQVSSGSAANDVKFEMKYSGTRLYNVQWFKRS